MTGATLLADLTTLRVGGPARETVEVHSADELAEAVLGAQHSGELWLVVGGGSNLLVGDDGVDGTVIRALNSGIERLPDVETSRRPVRLRVQAGENWEALVAHTVENGWAGIEALSGIPGSCGAAPVQNIGAYGQEIAESLVAVDVIDVHTGERRRVPAPELELGYRTSAIKRGAPWIVLSLDLALEAHPDARSRPVQYAQLADSLGVSIGDTAPLVGVRSAVLRLRASKGMVLDADDPNSVSAGSFFTNPIVSESFARLLPRGAPRWVMQDEAPALAVPLGAEPAPPPPATERQVKLSAAWLIENSGIGRGFSLGGSRAAVSRKHTLALVNTGGATAAEIAELARYIQTRVMSEFGVVLHPEPVLVGLEL